jgi:hypothetical protein
MKTFFTDIKLTTFALGKRLRVKPLEGQNVPLLFVSCSRILRTQLPLGSVFKADLKLIYSPNRKPYLVARKKDFRQLNLF